MRALVMEKRGIKLYQKHFHSILTSERCVGLGILVFALIVGAALRVWLSFNDDGIYWPDEIYQSLEPAHRLVFGYGLIAWEFILGARNWAFPGLLAALFKLSVLIGLDDPREYLGLTRLVFSGISVATAFGSYRLARAYGASTLAAASGAALFALVAPVIYFAPRAMSETASALPVVLGFSFALCPQARRWETLLGASLLGLAVLLRLQNGVFCAGLLGILVGRRQWRLVIESLGVLLIWAFLFGLLDRLTWGGWFHSAVVYLYFNLVMSAYFGTAPFGYYAQVLWASMGVPTVWLAGLSLLAFFRAPGLVLIALAFFLLHSCVPHKEMRFIIAVLPLFCALVGVGLDVVARSSPTWVYRTLASAVVISAAISTTDFRSLSFSQLGLYRVVDPHTSAYDYSGPVNRLLLVAHNQPDLCGLKVEAVEIESTGGYSYLHRPVPLYSNPGPPRESGLFNYVINFKDESSAGEKLAVEGDFVLLRLHQNGCVPDIEYQWGLSRTHAEKQYQQMIARSRVLRKISGVLGLRLKR